MKEQDVHNLRVYERLSESGNLLLKSKIWASLINTCISKTIQSRTWQFKLQFQTLMLTLTLFYGQDSQIFIINLHSSMLPLVPSGLRKGKVMSIHTVVTKENNNNWSFHSYFFITFYSLFKTFNTLNLFYTVNMIDNTENTIQLPIGFDCPESLGFDSKYCLLPWFLPRIFQFSICLTGKFYLTFVS